VVAILRERFDSSRVKAKAAAIDGLAMLELAKHQLEAHGMRVEETSFAKVKQVLFLLSHWSAFLTRFSLPRNFGLQRRKASGSCTMQREISLQYRMKLTNFPI
jgi:hypothetical protein